jgi:hypothetical protein
MLKQGFLQDIIIDLYRDANLIMVMVMVSMIVITASKFLCNVSMSV